MLFNTWNMPPISALAEEETTGWSRLSRMLISLVLKLHIPVQGGGKGRTQIDTYTLSKPLGSPLLSLSSD